MNFKSFLTKEIILVCGNLCSGKGHFCSTHYPNHVRIGVSDVVRSLTKYTLRSQLSTTKDLDVKIIEALVKMIEQHDKVIIDGIRQTSIIFALQKKFGAAIKDIIWLDVPETELRSRFKHRQNERDDVSFEQALKSDKELGIDEVEQYIRSNYKILKYY